METSLCICISTYNRVDKLLLLVKEILSCKSPKLILVVVDDNSTDGTSNKLAEIKDKRFSFFVNKENMGARGNWFETINRGKGTYLLHLLDRDWIHVGYIDTLIETLEHEKCGFGYIGRIFNLAPVNGGVIEKYPAGSKALEKFAFTLVHPSGFLVKKVVWDQIKDKEKFFKGAEYGIYPHSYVFALLALENEGIIVRYPLIETVNKASYARYKSKFYQNDKNQPSLWWTPKAHKSELELLTQYIYEELPVSNINAFNILQYRFHENLYDATIMYRSIAKDFCNADHYGVETKYLDENELLVISIQFFLQYLYFVITKCLGFFQLKFVWRLLDIEIKTIKDILSYK